MADSSLRADGRAPNQLRPLRFQNHIAPHAAGSTLVEWGNTRVICGVTIEETIPRWMKEQGVKGGWITAEYSMLPYSTLQRKQRDSAKGKIDGRSSGNPAAHRPRHARRAGPRQTRRTHGLGGLRRVAGRRRHAHRRHYRRLRRVVARGEKIDGREKICATTRSFTPSPPSASASSMARRCWICVTPRTWPRRWT